MATHLTTKLFSFVITMKMAELLAETCWWTYYELKYIIKMKCICWLFIHFANLFSITCWCQSVSPRFQPSCHNCCHLATFLKSVAIEILFKRWNQMILSGRHIGQIFPSLFSYGIKRNVNLLSRRLSYDVYSSLIVNPYLTAFPYGNGMVLHFYEQQESSTTKTVHKVINRGLKAYV